MLRAVDGFGADAVDALVDFSRSLVVSVFELALLFSLLVALVVPFLALELVIGPLVGASGSGGAVGLFLTPPRSLNCISLSCSACSCILGVLLTALLVVRSCPCSDCHAFCWVLFVLL